MFRAKLFYVSRTATVYWLTFGPCILYVLGINLGRMTGCLQDDFRGFIQSFYGLQKITFPIHLAQCYYRMSKSHQVIEIIFLSLHRMILSCLFIIIIIVIVIIIVIIIVHFYLCLYVVLFL
jgi:hypothetical protein